MNLVQTQPAEDELEVTVFGPGIGECVAVHIGLGEWIIVDSCVGAGDSEPAVLTYLDRIGVDVASQVVRVIASHAHKDHIAGIARVLERAKSAALVTSPAVTREEFWAAVEADARLEHRIRQSVRAEYRKLRELTSVGDEHGDVRTWKVTMEQQSVYARSASGSVPGVQITALSPSSASITHSLGALALDSGRPATPRKLSSQDPNAMSIALWIAFDDQRLLLGADLENEPEDRGWPAVLETFNPTTRAQVFKVPHHGSAGAHHDKVWSDLVQQPYSLITPYRSGNVDIPTWPQLVRIKDLSTATFLTSPSRPRLNKAQQRIQRQIRSVARDVRPSVGRTGVAQLRRRRGGSWMARVEDPAVAV